MEKIALCDAFSSKVSYYHRWYHDRPVAITSQRTDELRRLHRIIHTCILHFVENYEWMCPKWMPLGKRDMEILSIQKETPFRAGTYRPDYIITKDGELKICEITSRFFGHGIFLSYFSEMFARKFMAKFPGARWESSIPRALSYMVDLAEGRDEVYVLKSSDRTSAIPLYTALYEMYGKTVTVIEAHEVERRKDEWSRGGLLLSALNQFDILRMSDSTIEAMVKAGMISDLRNVFLVHDKRFMRMWTEEEFTKGCLSDEDALFLKEHTIETFVCEEESCSDILEEARQDKDSFILKPHRLGKSEGLYPGPLVDRKSWENLFERDSTGRRPVDGMILQRFLPQKTFPTVWEGTPFKDYGCGMMLCVDDLFFDSGMFRFSSLPVTNVGDDRKAAPIHTDDPEVLSKCDII